MPTYTIADDTRGGLQIHKHNCRDTARVDHKWDVESGDLRGIVEDTYGPAAGSFYEEAGYTPGTPEYDRAWQDYTHDFRVMPCAGRIEVEAVAR
jgi:hypothetical protein